MGADTQVYHSHKKKYFMVFLFLGVLTIAELIVADGMELAYMWKAIWLTVLALVKAWAVAYWYMHLEEETAWTKFIAAIPISAFIYAVVVILESVAR